MTQMQNAISDRDEADLMFYQNRLLKDEIEKLREALERLCYYWDVNLNNLNSGEEYEAREMARTVLSVNETGEKP